MYILLPLKEGNPKYIARTIVGSRADARQEARMVAVPQRAVKLTGWAHDWDSLPIID